MWASEERLRGIPWHGLEGLGPPLDEPLARVLAGAPAERVLAGWLRRHQDEVRGERRRAAAEAVFGVALWRRRLAPDGPLAPRAMLLRLARDLGGAGAAAAAAWLGVIAEVPPARPPRSLAERFSLPDWLAAELRAAAGSEAEAEALADALDRPGPLCLRANTLKVTRDALAARLEAEGVPTRPTSRAPSGLVVTERRRGIYGLTCWHEALFEVQDEGSQLVGEAVAARPGERVLDLCAGAGGKTLLLACQLGERGELCATDVDRERLGRLRARCRRAGVRSVRVSRRDAVPAGPFQRVLVDAPCSELGALRRGPDARWRLAPADFAGLPALQRSLLIEAAARLAPGGRLVYATCTVRAEENEEVATALERARPDLRRVAALPDASLLDPEGRARLLPHRHGTDGFFVAAWERPRA